MGNERKTSAFIQTIITAVAVIFSAGLSAYLTHQFGLSTIKETAKIEADKIALAAKYNLDAVKLSNQNALEVAKENNRNAVLITEKNAQMQRDITLEERKSTQKEKAFKAAKFFFSDIEAKMELLSKFYFSLKSMEDTLGPGHPVHSLFGLSGTMGLNRLNDFPVLSPSQLYIATDLDIYTEMDINNFFAKLRFTMKASKSINQKLISDYLKNIGSAASEYRISKDDEKKLAELALASLGVFFQGIKSLILECLEAGNKALLGINQIYIKDKKISSNTKRWTDKLNKERAETNEKGKAASSVQAELTKHLYKIYQQGLDKVFIDSFGSPLKAPK